MRTFIQNLVSGQMQPAAKATRKNRQARPGAEVMEDRKLFAIGGELIAPVNTANHEFESANASSWNGTHAVVWTVKNAITGERDIMGRVFYSSSAPKTGDFVINNEAGKQDSNPTVAMDSNGNMWVAWQRDNGGSRDVLAAKFDNNGNNLGGLNAKMMIAASAKDEYDPSIACNRAGDFVVSCSIDMGGGDTDIYARRCDSNGFTLGGGIIAGSPAAEGHSAVTRNMVGDYIITWQNNGVLPTGAINSDIQAIKFNNAGVPITPTLTIAGSTTLQETAPTVSIDQTGNSIFAWESGPTTANRDIIARRMSPAGALAPTFAISNVAAANETRPSIALAPTSGQFAVVYEYTAGGVTAAIDKEFSAANVNTLTANLGASRNMPVVSVGPNQQYIVTYTNLIGNAADPGLGVRRRHGQL